MPFCEDGVSWPSDKEAVDATFVVSADGGGGGGVLSLSGHGGVKSALGSRELKTALTTFVEACPGMVSERPSFESLKATMEIGTRAKQAMALSHLLREERGRGEGTISRVTGSAPPRNGGGSQLLGGKAAGS